MPSLWVSLLWETGCGIRVDHQGSRGGGGISPPHGGLTFLQPDIVEVKWVPEDAAPTRLILLREQQQVRVDEDSHLLEK